MMIRNIPNHSGSNRREPGVILVAEDDANEMLLLRYAFEEAGVISPIMDVRDGREAVNYLTGQPPYGNRSLYPFPSLLVVDLKMPVMTGFEVLAWLQNQADLKKLPVVVLSSSNADRDMAQARALGARDYLVKPSLLDDLIKLAGNLHARWLKGAALTTTDWPCR